MTLAWRTRCSSSDAGDPAHKAEGENWCLKVVLWLFRACGRTLTHGYRCIKAYREMEVLVVVMLKVLVVVVLVVILIQVSV